MTLPLIADYKKAVANAKVRFATLEVAPELDPQRHPQFLAGNFAGVFKVRDGTGALVAVKCFTREMPELEKRYRALATFIKTSRPPYLVELDYLPAELYVTSPIAADADYPVVVMPWLEGTTIGGAIETLCRNNSRKALAALTRAWAKLCRDLLARGIAHGDLKHDNVIITPDSKLRLIDYDSMYLPELKGMPATLVGGINYQHPLRTPRHFDEALDHFSILVMLLSLRALTVDPSLFEAYNSGENIILTRDDFVAPDASTLFQRFLQSPDFLVKDWTRHLIKAAKSRSIRIPAIRSIVDAAITLDATPKERGPRQLFSALAIGGLRRLFAATQ